MKTYNGKLFMTVMLTVCLVSTAQATHDSGNGKSQDGQGTYLESVSTAPEPSTFWLFLTGALALAAFNRYQKKGVTER